MKAVSFSILILRNFLKIDENYSGNEKPSHGAVYIGKHISSSKNTKLMFDKNRQNLESK